MPNCLPGFQWSKNRSNVKFSKTELRVFSCSKQFAALFRAEMICLRLEDIEEFILKL
jgi:hypothetical protein